MEAQVSGVRLAEQERQRIEQLVKTGYYVNLADFLRDAVRSKLKEFEFRFVRNVGLDIETVLKAIEDLAKERKVVYG